MTTKIVYNTADGIDVVAHEDQVTAGLFHLPAGATEVKPPTFTEKQTCQFIDEKWVVTDIPVPEVVTVPEIIETYQSQRFNEYPSERDQLDMLMKDMRDGTTTHQESCEAVKAKYPKPE